MLNLEAICDACGCSKNQLLVTDSHEMGLFHLKAHSVMREPNPAKYTWLATLKDGMGLGFSFAEA